MTISRQYGIDPALMAAVEDVNNRQNIHLARLVMANLSDEKKVSLLGLAFKDKTAVVEASPAISLIHELVINDIDVTVFDPLAQDVVNTIFGDEIAYASSIEEALKSAPVCVVTLMSWEYKTAIERFRPETPLLVIDCWRQINTSKIDRNISVIAAGRTKESAVAVSNVPAG
jgi:UDPglucose 6-dehydrogenase